MSLKGKNDTFWTVKNLKAFSPQMNANERK